MNIARLGFTLVTAVAITMNGSALADSWGPPVEFDAFSASGRFVAHVGPGDERTNAVLAVYAVNNDKRILTWAMELTNPTSPIDLYISDDGRHVITFDNYFGVGFGDDTVAIYDDSALLATYTLEALFNIPDPDDVHAHRTRLSDELDKLWDEADDLEDDDHKVLLEKIDRIQDEMERLEAEVSFFDGKFRHTVSSRWWREHSFGFFDRNDPVFCLWVDWNTQWIAWNMESGRTIAVQPEQITRWNDRCRSAALKRISDGNAEISDYVFLGKMKNAADKALVRKLLSDTEFWTGMTTTLMMDDQPPVYIYYAESERRSIADQILADWDQVKLPDTDDDQPYVFLGAVELSVEFPTPPKKTEGHLIVYLQPASREPPLVPQHYLVANLDNNYPFDYRAMSDGQLSKTVHFSIGGVTPGVYDIHVTWDKVEPFTESEMPPFSPQKGDFIAGRPVRVEIKAAQMTKGVFIECNNPVEQ